MTNEQLIFAVIGLVLTILASFGGMLKWAMGQMISKVDKVVDKFDKNSDKFMDRFESITENMNKLFAENESSHHDIGLKILKLESEVKHHHCGNNSHAK